MSCPFSNSENAMHARPHGPSQHPPCFFQQHLSDLINLASIISDFFLLFPLVLRGVFDLSGGLASSGPGSLY